MSRQVLTFLIVFAGLMLLMRSCAGKPSLPPAVPTSRAEPIEEADAVRLFDKDADVAVQLARDGTVVSARIGNIMFSGPTAVIGNNISGRRTWSENSPSREPLSDTDFIIEQPRSFGARSERLVTVHGPAGQDLF